MQKVLASSDQTDGMSAVRPTSGGQTEPSGGQTGRHYRQHLSKVASEGYDDAFDQEGYQNTLRD